VRVEKSMTVRVNTGNYEFVEYTVKVSVGPNDTGKDESVQEAATDELVAAVRETTEEVERLFPDASMPKTISRMRA
jgi:hypothetical protein